MNAMSMVAGPAMSMTWTRMPGQSWAGAASSFVAMWTAMMVAMMLPSLVPMLHRYRIAVGDVEARHTGLLTVLVGLGYYAVWSVVGAVVFPLGTLLVDAEQRLSVLRRIAPILTGVVVLVAGLAQLSEWKARHLAFDRNILARVREMPADVGTALRCGLCLGVHCVYCCAGPTASLLVLGVMDVRVMAVVTAAITAERLAPAGVRVARVIGVMGIVAGLSLIVQTM